MIKFIIQGAEKKNHCLFSMTAKYFSLSGEISNQPLALPDPDMACAAAIVLSCWKQPS